jgi:hypothetical protein
MKGTMLSQTSLGAVTGKTRNTDVLWGDLHRRMIAERPYSSTANCCPKIGDIPKWVKRNVSFNLGSGCTHGS